MTFVFLHGIEQQDKTADELLTLWIESIRVGLDRSRSRNLLPSREEIFMPYYGDLLAKLKPAMVQKASGDRIVRGIAPRNTRDDFPGQVTQSGTIDELLKEVIRARTGSHARQNLDSGQKTRGLASNALGALSMVVPIPAQTQIVNFALTQVAAYLDDASLKRTILDTVSSAIVDGAKAAEKNDEPLVVVGHSLGSVAALDALSKFKGRRVDLLMTIGSPLSTETVASRMTDDARRWPEAVRSWVNIADPDDVVALHHSIDRRNFLKNSSDEDRADIWNIVDVRNHMDNRHGIAGYLDDPVVAHLLTDKERWVINRQS